MTARADRTGIFYAKTDGSFIKEVVFPMDGPNGIGLGPNDKMLYVAETFTAGVWQWGERPRRIEARGRRRRPAAGRTGRYAADRPAGLPVARIHWRSMPKAG